MLQFTITELDKRDLREAWPLVRSASPQLRLEQWEELASELIDRGGGVVGVGAEGSGFLGVATYEAVDRPHAGKVLRVDTLVTFELSRRAPIRRILCDELDELAPKLGCDVITVALPNHSFLAARSRATLAVQDRAARVISERRSTGSNVPIAGDSVSGCCSDGSAAFAARFR